MISIAMATYNGEEFIAAQIESILCQSFKDFELIICDDKSTDSTLEILLKYQRKDRRIKIYCNERNLGFLRNFEKAISLCKGDYIALSDQDDIWTENHLQLLFDNLDDNVLVCGNSIVADSEGRSQGVNLKGKNFYIAETQEEQFIQLLHNNFVQGCTTLFKREILRRYFPIPKEQKFHDCWLALIASLEGKIGYIQEPILLYRQHGRNITINKKKNFFQKSKTLVQSFRESYRKVLERNQSLYGLDLTSDLITIIDEANAFLEASSKKCFRFRFIPYFLKNYRLIYHTKNKAFLPLRFIKKFILCI